MFPSQFATKLRRIHIIVSLLADSLRHRTVQLHFSSAFQGMPSNC